LLATELTNNGHYKVNKSLQFYDCFTLQPLLSVYKSQFIEHLISYFQPIKISLTFYLQIKGLGS